MKVLLLGDYSGLHLTLSKGLKELGVDVTIASTGDGWKNYDRDIDLAQPDKFKRIRFIAKIIKALPKLQGYDVVQMIHCNPLSTSWGFNKIFWEFIKRRNKNIFLGANGMDHYYSNYALDGHLKYSVFQVPDIEGDPEIQKYIQDAGDEEIARQNKMVAEYATGITACSVGYYLAHKASFPDKTTYIPLPLNTDLYPYVSTIQPDVEKVHFFLGKQKGREVRKGVDVMERVLNKLLENYPNDMELRIVTSVPFQEYQKMLNSSHVLLDQRYSYGIGMNGLIALSKGLIVGGGAEMYSALEDFETHPIIDLNVTEGEMYHAFEQLLLNKSKLKEYSLRSREFVVKHHNYIQVAQKYLDFWQKMC